MDLLSSESEKGVFTLALTLGQRSWGVGHCCEDLLGILSGSLERVSQVPKFPREALFTAVWAWEILMIPASFGIVDYFAGEGLDSSIGQNLFVFLLPTEGQRRSWLIQKCCSKIRVS